MKVTRHIARRLLFWGGFALIVWPLYELIVRLDAMIGPLRMFFNMAIGERVPLANAMGYVDWSIFETPAFLLACLLLGVFSLGLRKKRKASLLLMPVAAAFGVYGWLDTPLFPIRTYQMLKLLPFLAVFLGGCFHMLANIARNRRKRSRSVSSQSTAKQNHAA